MAKKPEPRKDDFRAKPKPKNDDFRRKPTAEDRYQSGYANEAMKARRSLDSANEGLRDINEASPRGGMENPLVKFAQVSGELARRGVRAVQGKPSLSELKRQRQNAERILQGYDAQRRGKAPGANSLTSFRDETDVPRLGMKRGGMVKSNRGWGCARKGKS